MPPVNPSCAQGGPAGPTNSHGWTGQPTCSGLPLGGWVHPRASPPNLGTRLVKCLHFATLVSIKLSWELVEEVVWSCNSSAQCCASWDWPSSNALQEIWVESTISPAQIFCQQEGIHSLGSKQDSLKFASPFCQMIMGLWKILLSHK